ncbi:BNR repeat-containing family member, partial [Rhizoctonia solani]
MRSLWVGVWALLALVVPYLVVAAPTVTRQSSTQLDAQGIFFVSYDGLVNVESFQQSGVVTYNGYQYAGWYTSTRYAILARRQLPSGSWSTLQLPHQLSVNDSHNVIAIGISPSDGRIHIAMDTHSTVLYYVKSVTNLAGSPGSFAWTVSQFGAVQTTLDGASVTNQFTYPQFLITPDNRLQLFYRSAVSGNGVAQVAEYNGASWTNLGGFTSATGSYTYNGATSTARNLYINGVTYSYTGRLHTSGTWRENNGGVTIAFPPPTYLMTEVHVEVTIAQESQTVDSANQPHVIISYVPGRFTQCVKSYAADRTSYARPFHLYRSSSGTWTKVEIPFALGSSGRSQIVMDASDNIYVVLPFLKIVTASKSSSWTDWTLAYDGVAAGLNAFGEVTIDRPRVKSEGVLSVLYQVKSSGTTPSAVVVADFKLNG